MPWVWQADLEADALHQALVVGSVQLLVCLLSGCICHAAHPAGLAKEVGLHSPVKKVLHVGRKSCKTMLWMKCTYTYLPKVQVHLHQALGLHDLRSAMQGRPGLLRRCLIA